MREIIFRGKSVATGNWVYGDLRTRTPAIYHNGEWIIVDPETIGQYTGMDDGNGNKIFEGDILEHWLTATEKSIFVGLVGYEEGTFIDRAPGRDDKFPLRFSFESIITRPMVAGNRYENGDILADDIIEMLKRIADAPKDKPQKKKKKWEHRVEVLANKVEKTEWHISSVTSYLTMLTDIIENEGNVRGELHEGIEIFKSFLEEKKKEIHEGTRTVARLIIQDAKQKDGGKRK